VVGLQFLLLIRRVTLAETQPLVRFLPLMAAAVVGAQMVRIILAVVVEEP